jgi:prepilin-type N-terminal cleavage/methylation domain-containing protein
MIKSAGFTLLELIIALAIAAMLSASLTLFLSQSNTYQIAVQNRASVYTRAIVFFHQFEKDLSGAHIPMQNKISEQQKKEKTEQAGKKPAIPEKKPAAAKEPETKKEEPIKPLSRVFYLEQKDNNMQQLTFITNNPLKVYWSSSIGAPKPSIARVVYYLKPDPDHANSFILMRQEGTDLDISAYEQKAAKAVRAYEVIDGIQSCSIRLVVIEHEQEKEKEKTAKEAAEKEPTKTAPKPTDTKAPFTTTEYTSWNWPLTEKKQTDGEKQPSSVLPHLVSLTLRLWDAQYDRTVECTYTITIYAALTPTEEAKKPEEQTEDKAEEEKTEQPKQPTPAQQPPGSTGGTIPKVSQQKKEHAPFDLVHPQGEPKVIS